MPSVAEKRRFLLHESAWTAGLTRLMETAHYSTTILQSIRMPSYLSIYYTSQNAQRPHYIAIMI